MTPSRLRSFLLVAGHFFFRRRNAVFPLVLIVLLALSPPRPSFGNWGADRWADAAGVLLVILGQAIRVAVIGLAYIRRGGREGRVHADDLVVDGLFAHARNPLYAGNLLILAGLFVAANSPGATWIGAPFFAFAYAAIVAAEEDFLANRFGAAFEAYRNRVPRFIPRDWNFAPTVRSMQFDWRRVLRKEYGSTFVNVTILLAVFAQERAVEGGRAALAAAAPELAAAWGATIAAYLAVRVMKKTGRLRKAAAFPVG